MTHLLRSRAFACLWLACWASGHICSGFLEELSKTKWGQLSLEQKLSGVKHEVCVLASCLEQTPVSFPGLRSRANSWRQLSLGTPGCEPSYVPTPPRLQHSSCCVCCVLSPCLRTPAATQGTQQGGISAVPGDSLHMGLSGAQEEEKHWKQAAEILHQCWAFFTLPLLLIPWQAFILVFVQ